MGNFLHLALSGSKPIMGGFDFFWKTILDRTSDDAPEFTYRDIDGACQPGFERHLKRFLTLLVTAGFVEVVTERPAIRDARRYRLVKRQLATPVLTEDGRLGVKGVKQQQMWNVMRRAHQGFTIEELRVSASTDSVVIPFRGAKAYVQRLQKAGAIAVQRRRGGAAGPNTYVLKGSANTGPRAPKIYRTDFMYDPNTGLVLGNADASEVSE